METAHAHSKPLPAPCSVLYTQNNTFALTAVTAAEFQMGRAQRFTLARGHTTPWQGRNFSFEPTRSTAVFLPSASPVTLPAATATSCLLPSRSPAVALAEMRVSPISCPHPAPRPWSWLRSLVPSAFLAVYRPLCSDSALLVSLPVDVLRP